MPGPSTSIAARPIATKLCKGRLAKIIGGMREGGNPARRADQGDGLGDRDARLGHVGRAAVAEVQGERGAAIRDLARCVASQSARWRRPIVARG